MEVRTEMHTPLEGIRVLEWGIFHAGPGGSAILADMGAEVIKIEQPVLGDPIRMLANYKDIDFNFGDSRNIFHEGANRGKKGITLDLAHEKGREIAYKILEKCDVFMTNLRPMTIEAMKMDYETLSGINPKLVYAMVSCYGSKGPDANLGGFDYQGQGRAGLMTCLGEPGEKPGVAQFGMADQSTAIMASYQIVTALLMRERFGIGQKVETSILGTVSYMMYFNNLVASITDHDVPLHEQAKADPQRNYYRCGDGKWIIHNQPPGEQNWRAVCEVLGEMDLATDLRYNSRKKRLERSEELVKIFNQAFLRRPRDEWLRLFSEKNLVISAVNTTKEAVQDMQQIENGYLVDFDHPEIGTIRIPGFPIQFSGAELNRNFIGPRLGEHTEEVLKSIGGYTDAEIEQFKKEKVI